MDLRQKHKHVTGLASRKKRPEQLDEIELVAENTVYFDLGNNLGGPRAAAIRREMVKRGLDPDKVFQQTPESQIASKEVVAIPLGDPAETVAGMLNALVDVAQTPAVKRSRKTGVTPIISTSKAETIEQAIERLGGQGFPNLNTSKLQTECAAKIRLAQDRTGSSPGTPYAVYTFGEGERATWDEEPADFVPHDAKVLAQISNGEITFVSSRRK